MATASDRHCLGANTRQLEILALSPGAPVRLRWAGVQGVFVGIGIAPAGERWVFLRTDAGERVGFPLSEIPRDAVISQFPVVSAGDAVIAELFQTAQSYGEVVRVPFGKATVTGEVREIWSGTQGQPLAIVRSGASGKRFVLELDKLSSEQLQSESQIQSRLAQDIARMVHDARSGTATLRVRSFRLIAGEQEFTSFSEEVKEWREQRRKNLPPDGYLTLALIQPFLKAQLTGQEVTLRTAGKSLQGRVHVIQVFDDQSPLVSISDHPSVRISDIDMASVRLLSPRFSKQSALTTLPSTVADQAGIAGFAHAIATRYVQTAFRLGGIRKTDTDWLDATYFTPLPKALKGRSIEDHAPAQYFSGTKVYFVFNNDILNRSDQYHFHPEWVQGHSSLASAYSYAPQELVELLKRPNAHQGELVIQSDIPLSQLKHILVAPGKKPELLKALAGHDFPESLIIETNVWP